MGEMNKMTTKIYCVFEDSGSSSETDRFIAAYETEKIAKEAVDWWNKRINTRHYAVDISVQDISPLHRDKLVNAQIIRDQIAELQEQLKTLEDEL